jgi:uncharacterized protein (TIGR03067 family)
MRLLVFSFLAGALAFASQPADVCSKGTPPDKKTDEPVGVSDHKKFQGAWRPISAEKRGKKATDEEIAGLEFKFEGDKVHVTSKGRTEPEAAFKLDPAKNPKEIDITPNEKTFILGIYKFDGDRLTLRFGKGMAARPAALDGDIGVDEMRLILERKPK